MKKLKVDLADLIMAFESSDWEMNHYLDLETGQVIVVDAEIQGQLDDLYAELDDAEVELPDDLAEGVSLQKADETRVALRELGLDESGLQIVEESCEV